MLISSSIRINWVELLLTKFREKHINLFGKVSQESFSIELKALWTRKRKSNLHRKYKIGLLIKNSTTRMKKKDKILKKPWDKVKYCCKKLSLWHKFPQNRPVRKKQKKWKSKPSTSKRPSKGRKVSIDVLRRLKIVQVSRNWSYKLNLKIGISKTMRNSYFIWES